MATQDTDFGGGHSPREFDPKTRKFVDDTSARQEPSTGLVKRSRVSLLAGRGSVATNLVRAAVGAGLLLFGWRLMSAAGTGRNSRRRNRFWAAARRR